MPALPGMFRTCMEVWSFLNVAAVRKTTLAAFEYIFVVGLASAASFGPVGFEVVGFSHLYFILV